ncbi:MAG: 1,4-dihydroxy-2-naphthoate polyprenyltransferase [Firmicutes bacterium]|nr:1,4-dihydroxy-2-naphthoate polyprenyltransferase [Bacillota bacterium]
MPQRSLSRDQKQIPLWRGIWRLLRPLTLTASIMPTLIGTAVAIEQGAWHSLLFVAMLVASLLIQVAVNMFNEYYDWRRGLDTADSVGIAGVIVVGGMKASLVRNLAVVFFLIALLLGAWICSVTSWWVAVVGAISMAVGYFYSGGPYPIAYTPFGELAAAFFMGPVIVVLAYFIQTGDIAWSVWLHAVPISVLTGSILMANNIRDRVGDQRKRRHTLAIRLGHEDAVRFLGGMFAVAYLWTLGLVAVRVASLWLLLVVLALPVVGLAIRRLVGPKQARQMLPGMKATAQHHALFGLLYTLGLLLP